MAYHHHFKLADDLVLHLDSVFAGLRDPFLESRYTGFVAVSAVTVLELSLKTIFLEFAAAKHKVLDAFCRSFFERINGRISFENINKDYLPRFGDKYRDRFKKKLDRREELELRTAGTSMKSYYGNLIVWRNNFAHEGTLPATATYRDVKIAYGYGKDIMQLLSESMRR